jgi:hypothetical protein
MGRSNKAVNVCTASAAAPPPSQICRMRKNRLAWREDGSQLYAQTWSVYAAETRSARGLSAPTICQRNICKKLKSHLDTERIACRKLRESKLSGRENPSESMKARYGYAQTERRLAWLSSGQTGRCARRRNLGMQGRLSS